MKNQQNLKTPQAFTLAEVLITLAIIGVVASITIASVISNSQKQEFVAGLQKNYNTFNQAIALSQEENGDLTTWPWETLSDKPKSDAFLQTYIIPYLKVLKNCSYTTNQKCMADKGYNHLDGTFWVDFNTSGSHYKMQLSDGATWNFIFSANCISNPRSCLTLYVDVNGQKGPNVLGRDAFRMDLYPFTNQIIFFGIISTPYNEADNSWAIITQESMEESCKPEKPYSGISCGAKIQRDGWQMKY